jgi:beta-N-acetylhexosaminidase
MSLLAQPGATASTSSTWSALRNRVFSALRMAALTSNTGARKVAVGVVLGLLVALPLLPDAQGSPTGAQTDCRTFPETGKTVCGRFLQYWNEHGGLAQQGLPIGDVVGEISATDGKTYTVQYFERAVFEYHPENNPPYDILLSLIGVFRYQQKYPNGAPGQQANTSHGARFFPETGHTVGGGFLEYWNAHGGLADQGYPLSEEFAEVSDLNGQSYMVQYFERAVFEYHPENPSPYTVLLSQLGTFRYQQEEIVPPWVAPPVAVPPAIVPPPTPLPTDNPAPTPTLRQRIDAYISKLTLTQRIGELIMFPVYADVYSADYNVYLQQDQISNAIMFTAYDGGTLKPTTLTAFRQLTHDVIAHSPNPMIIATDEEGGSVDRIAPYYGTASSPAQIVATGNPQNAYALAKLDASRLIDIGINADFAPLADVDQGGAIDPSRMFGTTPDQVTQYAGAFLDGLQQNGVVGTVKHWPGIGSANANPDFSLPTIIKTRAQLNATDFVTFRNLLPHDPGMIMVTHAMEPAYDTKYPASLSPTLIDEVLRGQLGYQGVVVSDALAAGAIGSYMRSLGFTDPAQAVGEASVLAIVAGEDIVECPNDSAQVAGTVTALTQAVQSGRITQAGLKLSLERIIALKVRMGLISLEP